MRFFLSLELILLGVILTTERNKCEDIYKEYFGENYKFSFDEGHSLIVSNHTAWIVN